MLLNFTVFLILNMAKRKFEFLGLFSEIQYIEKKFFLRYLSLNPITQY